MIVTNNGWQVIACNKEIIINDKIINILGVNLSEYIAEIQSELHIEKDQILTIDRKPEIYSLADTVLLVAIGLLCPYVFSSSEHKKYEITFSCNFPIVCESEFMKGNLIWLYEIAESQLVTLGEYGDFTRVYIENNACYEAFLKRNRYLLNKNDREIEISEAFPLSKVLENWQHYCRKKFGVDYSPQVLQTYLKIYGGSGFATRIYIFHGDVIAQGVTFESSQSRTLYYCIFAWDETYKSKSPGIYAYCKAIQECHNKGYAFSFCYGHQEYKSKILREFLK